MIDDENTWRKPQRLGEYDYSQTGAYFVTVCAKNRAQLFGHIVGVGVLDDPIAELSEYGKIIDDRIREMNEKYPNVSVDKYAIMPNHIHLLLIAAGSSRTPTPTRANELIPAFISTLKRMTNKTAGEHLWQRGYYYHIIRDEGDYKTKWQYIDENPARWAEDEYF